MTNGKVTDLEIDKSMGAFLERISFEKILLLEKLREKYRVFLLSNTNPIAINVVKEYFREHGKNMNDCFEKMFLSYEMNLAKPDPKIFEEMLTDGEMVASQTLFIDDAPANIEIAKGLGIQTYLFGKDDSLVDVMYTCLK
jgi:putative hydrolase of the HAD superfamily